MSVQATLQAAFAQFMLTVPESVVAVIIGSTTGTGMPSVDVERSDLSILGEQGTTTGWVRVSASTFTTAPTRGQTIIVAGNKVTVTEVHDASVGAFWLIGYTQQKPID